MTIVELLESVARGEWSMAEIRPEEAQDLAAALSWLPLVEALISESGSGHVVIRLRALCQRLGVPIFAQPPTPDLYYDAFMREIARDIEETGL